MSLRITDISMQDLLRMAKGATDGHFVVAYYPTGLQFIHVTTEELKKLKDQMTEKEANA